MSDQPEPTPASAARPMPRPTGWQVISTVALLAMFALPIFLVFTVPWGWALFAAFYFWPSCGQIGWYMWRDRDWPVITGGPSISYAGRSYGLWQGGRR